MAKFNLNLRDADATGETPVHLIARWSGQRVVINTGYSVIPKFWDKKAQRLTTAPGNDRRDIHKQVNAKLSKRISDAEESFVEFETANKRKPTAAEFMAVLKEKFGIEKRKQVKPTGLFEFVEQFLAEMDSGVNPKNKKPYAPGTVRTYRQSLTILKEYARDKRQRIDFDTISMEFYLSYYEYLTGRGFRPNYVGKVIKTLKTFLNEALERGLTTNIAHKSKRFTAPKEKVSNIYLTLDELKGLWQLDLSNEPRLENVRDLFLFGCFTGLRFSDFSKVRTQDIDLTEGIIDIQTQKTGELVSIPIFPITRAILSKYEGKTENSLPASISNQKFNLYLKEIGQRFIPLQTSISKDSTIGGKKVSQNVPKWQLLTTHTARRSFATNMYLMGIPAQSIMKITGHRTEAAFMTYLKMSPRENAKVILREWESKFAINQ